MSHEISQKQMNLGDFRDTGQHRIKDSLLLAIVFFVGLLGTCYILHVALSHEQSTGYLNDSMPDTFSEAEAIYVTDAGR